MTSYLRPDELANESEIRKSKGRTKELRSGLETAASLGTTALAGKAASKILPLLSEYIPENLAYKGINKLMPGVGDFLKNGMKQGLSLKSGLDFLKKELTQSESKQEPAKQNKNIIEQESPELHSFLLDQIKKGRKPIEAAAIAQNDKRFSETVKKLMKKHNTPWSSIIESLFGRGDMALPQQNEGQQQGQLPQTQQPQQGQQGISPAKQGFLQAVKELTDQLRS